MIHFHSLFLAYVRPFGYLLLWGALVGWNSKMDRILSCFTLILMKVPHWKNNFALESASRVNPDDYFSLHRWGSPGGLDPNWCCRRWRHGRTGRLWRTRRASCSTPRSRLLYDITCLSTGGTPCKWRGWWWPWPSSLTRGQRWKVEFVKCLNV